MPSKGGFEEQPGDIEIVHSLHLLRVATIDHLAAILRRSKKALQRRLGILEHQHYVRSAEGIIAKNLWAIGTTGVHALVEAGYAPREVEERRLYRHNELSPIQ